MDCVGPFCVMNRYGSSRLGKSQDWKAKATCFACGKRFP
jgi:hypothetical protein